MGPRLGVQLWVWFYLAGIETIGIYKTARESTITKKRREPYTESWTSPIVKIWMVKDSQKKRWRKNTQKDKKRSNLLASKMYYCSCFHYLCQIFFIWVKYTFLPGILLLFSDILIFDSLWTRHWTAIILDKTLEFGPHFHVVFLKEESKSKLFWFKTPSFPPVQNM